MSPYTPPGLPIEDTLELRGSVGTVTFSGHLDERSGVDGIEVEVFGWCLEIIRSEERDYPTYDSRLRIARINPVINFESVQTHDCRFMLGEGHGRRIEGQGRLVNYDATFQNLEIEAHGFSIHSAYPYSCRRPTFDRFDFGGNRPSEKPNKRAEALLLSVLDKKQQNQYQTEMLFYFSEQAKQRLWRFRLAYHYPVGFMNPEKPEADFQGLCIDLDQETPTEDILLICYLEVKGGRGGELIKAGTGEWPSVPQWCPPLERRPSDPVPEPPRRPSAIVSDDVEDRETCTHAVDRARLNVENAWDARAADHARLNRERLFQAMIGVTDEERYAITRERLSHAIGNLRLNTERLVRSMEQATENLRILRRVFQQATVGGEQGVSCSPVMHNWIRENVSQANFVPGEQIDRFRYIGTLFGMDVIVDQQQREPIRVIDVR